MQASPNTNLQDIFGIKFLKSNYQKVCQRKTRREEEPSSDSMVLVPENVLENVNTVIQDSGHLSAGRDVARESVCWLRLDRDRRHGGGRAAELLRGQEAELTHLGGRGGEVPLGVRAAAEEARGRVSGQ